MKLGELVVLSVFLVVVGVASFYGARVHWSRVGTGSRRLLGACLIVAGVGACFALGWMFLNWR